MEQYMRILSIVLATTIMVAPMSSVGATQPYDIYRVDGVSLQDELTCLAKNIYFEARNESAMGQLAVAYVTLNRVSHKHFPKTICGVVKEGIYKESWKTKQTKDPYDAKMIPVRNRCQFSWWCDGKSDKVMDRDAWELSVHIAAHALQEYGTLKHSDPTDGALYYHADYVKSRFHNQFKRTIKIGAHIFYKDDRG